MCVFSEMNQNSEMYGAVADTFFAAKAIMKTNPYPLIFGAYFVSILVFGNAIRICEWPANRSVPEDELGETMASLWTSCWVVVLGMTGVGYGDFYPVTTLGRLVTAISCLWGIIIISFMIVTFVEFINISGFDENALMVLNRLKVKEAIRNHAGYILTLLAKFGKHLVKDGKSNLKIRSKLLEHANALKQEKNYYRGLESQNFREDLSRQFSMVLEDYSSLKLSLKKQAVYIDYIARELGIQRKVEPYLGRILNYWERQTFIKNPI